MKNVWCLKTTVIFVFCILSAVSIIETVKAEERNTFDDGKLIYEVTSSGESNEVCLTGYVQGTNAGKLSIPKSVIHNKTSYTLTSIGRQAFSNCPDYTGDLEIPDTVKFIAAKAFENTYGFTGKLVLNEGLEKIEGEAFNGAGFTGNLIIPSTVKEIGAFAFNTCKNFNGTLKLPEGLAVISDYAFSGTGFTGSLDIPASVRIIGTSAFENSFKETKGYLTFHEGLVKINESAFSFTGFHGKIEVPPTVTFMNGWAFDSCPNITEFVWPDSITNEPNSLILQHVPITKVGFHVYGSYTYNGISDLYSRVLKLNKKEQGTILVEPGAELTNATGQVLKVKDVQNKEISIKPGDKLYYRQEISFLKQSVSVNGEGKDSLHIGDTLTVSFTPVGWSKREIQKGQVTLLLGNQVLLEPTEVMLGKPCTITNDTAGWNPQSGEDLQILLCYQENYRDIGTQYDTGAAVERLTGEAVFSDGQIKTYTGKPFEIAPPVVTLSNGTIYQGGIRYFHTRENGVQKEGLPVDAGIYQILVQFDEGGYLIEDKSIQARIDRAVLTVSGAEAKSGEVSSTRVPVLEALALAGAVNGEELKLNKDYAADVHFLSAPDADGNNVNVTNIRLLETNISKNYQLEAVDFHVKADVEQKLITENMVGNIDDTYIYDRGAYEPRPYVSGGLSRGDDYDLIYTNNVNAGTAMVTVEGKGDYSGSVERKFPILKRKLDWITDALTVIQDNSVFKINGELKLGGILKNDEVLLGGNISMKGFKKDGKVGVIVSGAVLAGGSAGNYSLPGLRFLMDKPVEDITSLPGGTRPKLSNPKYAVMNIDILKIRGAEGYRAVYGTDAKLKNGTKTVTLSSDGKTIKGLKYGKTYYVKICGYRTDAMGNKVYGKYGSTVGISLVNCQVKFSAEGGRMKTSTKTVTPKKRYGKMPVPERKNYLFAGWYTKKNGGSLVTDKTKVKTKKDHKLYAYWNKVTVGAGKKAKLKNVSKLAIQIKIQKVKGVDGYRIVYGTDAKLKKDIKTLTTSKNKVSVKKLTKGKTYYVKVCAYRKDSAGNKVLGSYGKISSVKVKK